MNNTASTQGDTISRSELKKAVNDFFDNHFKGLVPNELITYAKAVDNAIDNAPTVEPSQNTEHDALQYTKGYQSGFLDAKEIFTSYDCENFIKSIANEMVGILKDVMPQVVEIAKEHTIDARMKGGTK